MNVLAPTPTSRPGLWLPAALLLLFPLSACSGDPAGTENGLEKTDTVSAQLAVDRGEVGVVVDVRGIVKKGYVATTVAIAFPDHAEFNATLDVDPVTSLAILRIHNDSLTAAEKAAFSQGVAAHFIVYDAGGGELAVHDATDLVLDDSGVPLRIETPQPLIPRPLVLREGVPYLLQPENEDGVLFQHVTGSLGTETATALVGRDGGGDGFQDLRCPAGSVAIGYHGSEAQNNVDAIGLKCAVLESGGTLGARSKTSWIGVGGVAVEIECPVADGTTMLLVRDSGHINPMEFGINLEPLIRNVRGRCLRVEDIGVNGTATTSGGQLGGAAVAGDQPYDLSCPTGSVVTGIRGEEAIFDGFVQQIGYFCRVVVVDWDVGSYLPDTPTQQFYFTAVEGAPDDNTYVVRQSSGYWVVAGGVLTLSALEADAGRFVLEQDADGWVRIRSQDTPEYLVREADGRIVLSATAASRFRLITDNIDWTVTDRGTVYHQPIVPPAQLDFAYAATIKNCSPARVTETIGRTESRTQTATMSTSESLQLFAGYELSVGAKIGVEVEGQVGVASVTGSAEVSTNFKVTNSETRTSDNTLTEESSKTSEVSRTRSIEVPPFTAIEAYDAVRTINDFRIPFTQVYRFSGTYREDGSRLTGSEILTSMQFNFVEGVPTAVGAEHVDIGIRGVATVDQMFEAETQVKELAGACN